MVCYIVHGKRIQVLVMVWTLQWLQSCPPLSVYTEVGMGLMGFRTKLVQNTAWLGRGRVHVIKFFLTVGMGSVSSFWRSVLWRTPQLQTPDPFSSECQCHYWNCLWYQTFYYWENTFRVCISEGTGVEDQWRQIIRLLGKYFFPWCRLSLWPYVEL